MSDVLLAVEGFADRKWHGGGGWRLLRRTFVAVRQHCRLIAGQWRTVKAIDEISKINNERGIVSL